MTHQLSGVLCCALGDEQFAFHSADVRLVARAEQMVVQAPRDGRLGVLHHNAVAVPIYSLAAMLGLPPRPARGTSHIVVTSGARGQFGVLVDRAVRVGNAERFDVLPLPPFVGPPAGRWFAGILHGTDMSCLLLSPGGLEPGEVSAPPMRQMQGRRSIEVRGRTEAADIVVVFRTAALPSCEADRYALGARQVGAVVQTLPSVSLPGAPRFVTGVSWWRGTAVPLIDFNDRDRRASHSRHLLVRTRDGAYAGLPVEADIALRRATVEDRKVSAGTAAFVTGLFAVGDERIALIDVDALVATDATAPVALCAG